MNTNATQSFPMRIKPVRRAFPLLAPLILFALILATSPVTRAQQRDILPLPSTGNVTLSLDEYNRLITLPAKHLNPPDRSPLNSAIQHADLKLRVTTDSVLGSIQLEGETYTKT